MPGSSKMYAATPENTMTDLRLLSLSFFAACLALAVPEPTLDPQLQVKYVIQEQRLRSATQDFDRTYSDLVQVANKGQVDRLLQAYKDQQRAESDFTPTLSEAIAKCQGGTPKTVSLAVRCVPFEPVSVGVR